MSHLIKVSLVLMLFSVSFVYAQAVVNEHSIKFTSTTAATLVGDDGVIMRTTNGGISWSEQTSNVTNVLLGNSHKSGLSIVAGENGVILRSDDNGANWDLVLPGTLEHLNDAEVTTSNTAVVCGDNGTVLITADGGMTWNEVYTGLNHNLNDIKFINMNVGYITGEMGTLLKSVNSGYTWVKIDMSFTNNKFNAIEAIDENNLVLVGDNGTIFVTNNGGESWYGHANILYESNLNDIVFYSSTDGVIAGDDGLILKTTNGGSFWFEATRSFQGDNYDFYSVAFGDMNNGISTGKDGSRIYSTDGGSTWSLTNPGVQVAADLSGIKGLKLGQNYPNPFNPSTVISFELPKDANVSLKVYDISGKEVASLLNGYLATGSHSVNFNASGLASGVYFYKLNIINGGENTSKVMKMILTK